MDVPIVLQALQKEIFAREMHLELELLYAPLADPSNPKVAIGSLLQQQQLIFDPNDDWTALTPTSAMRLFARLFTKSLAYDADLLAPDEALRYWATFSKLMHGKISYYTNLYDAENFQQGKSYGWFPVSENTFDVALFLVDSEKIIGLIVTDED
jgi:hypothetical protein